MRHVFICLVLLCLAACAGPQPPQTPPAYTEPPTPATEGLIVAEASAVVDIGPAALRAFLADNPMTGFLTAPTACRPPSAQRCWSATGQSRGRRAA